MICDLFAQDASAQHLQHRVRTLLALTDIGLYERAIPTWQREHPSAHRALELKKLRRPPNSAASVCEAFCQCQMLAKQHLLFAFLFQVYTATA
eukprot:scaffold166822_cov33-Tisochrysis_lutea.AAC.4